jgi:Chaperone for flagella basal body P-ring formation
MRNSLGSRIRYLGLISSVTLQGILVATSARATCYGTPYTAIDEAVASSLSPPAVNSGGYKVTKIQSDPVLGQRWVTIVSCGHPEWPAFVLRANGTSSSKASQESRPLTVSTAPVVRAGDIVRLWRQESLLRIEAAGVSEESGDLGKTIRVRLLRRNTDDQSIPEQFSGIVRGPLNVEILP